MKYLNVKADPGEFEKLMKFVFETLAGSEQQNRRLVNDIRLVCEEIFLNIASYAYSGDGDVTVGCEKHGGKICIVTIDSGVPFNLLEADDPDIGAEIEERDEGGLGVFIVKNIMDNIEYKREDGKNILTMYKNTDGIGA